MKTITVNINMLGGDQVTEGKFLNGFQSWHETHYLISAHLAATEDKEGTQAFCRAIEQGIGGLWELAEELTDEFETIHGGEDGEWMEELALWLHKRDAECSNESKGA